MKRGTPRHPKVAHLCRLMNISKPLAIGYLEMLWHFTAEFAPQGDIGKFSDEEIERAVEYSGKGRQTGRLVSALLASGWLEGHPKVRLLVHDWAEHIDETTKKRLTRKGLTPISGGQRRTTADNGSLPEPVPEPEPVHTQRARVAADMNGQTSQRGAEFCRRYPLKDDQASTLRAYLSFVTVDAEAPCFACLERYLASDRVARGMVLPGWKWLRQQSENSWKGEWPTTAAVKTAQSAPAPSMYPDLSETLRKLKTPS